MPSYKVKGCATNTPLKRDNDIFVSVCEMCSDHFFSNIVMWRNQECNDTQNKQ